MFHLASSAGRFGWVLQATLLISALWVGGLFGQDVRELPRFRINSRDDLITALLAPDGEADLRPAVVALEGRRIAPWIRDILEDPGLPAVAKERALAVLYYTRDSLLVGAVLRLWDMGAGMTSVRAKEVLQVFPYEPVCQRWRAMAGNATTPTHELSTALVGLGYCGSSRDEDLLERVQTTAPYEYLRDLAAEALARVRLPLDERFSKDIWASPPAPSGDFIPGAQLVGMIQQAACGGPCRDQVLLSPSSSLSAARQQE
jgi:hypothetical protein